jgi:hypothetical protein
MSDPKHKPPAVRQEVLPPERSNIRSQLTERNPTGLIDNALTGFMAGLQARTLRRITERNLAQQQVNESRDAVRASYEKLMRGLDRLNDLPAILREDQRARDDERRAAQEQRDQAEHERLIAAHRRARERDDLEFIAAANNASHRAALADALRKAVEAERMSEAAGRISDDEVSKLYYESAARRIDAEFQWLMAQDSLAGRRGERDVTASDTSIFDRIIEVTEQQIETYRNRGMDVGPLVDLLVTFRRARAEAKEGPA